ncbi:unnamed protein product [Clonostachys byssicola]|uniref:DJ-1/PfpI domain-containing protein n=1 Tax=Clonostachys byssicola TaxID=160290 RepID=A0A9N9UWA2_9HYPO|nr:unnamed protein product [Clonostachys byssicola]
MNPLRVGTLVFPYQAIDTVGPLDVLSSGSKLVSEFLRVYGPVDEVAAKKAPEVEFHHIGVSKEPVPLTAGFLVVPTVTIEDAPELDILLIGGPVPDGFELDPKYAQFIRQHVAAGKLLWTNCTGAFVAASAGVLDGKRATINNVEFEWVKKRFPAVNWTKETKWVVDGNIWTAAGAVAGMDMVTHWLKEQYGPEVHRLSTMGLDFEPRDTYGVLNVLPKRYDAAGRQLFTHEFFYFDSY